MTNEKWWNDEAFSIITDMNEHGEVTGEEPDIEKIVAEATRRGEEKAWREAGELINFDGSSRRWLMHKVSDKLTSLKTP